MRSNNKLKTVRL